MKGFESTSILQIMFNKHMWQLELNKYKFFSTPRVRSNLLHCTESKWECKHYLKRKARLKDKKRIQGPKAYIQFNNTIYML